MASIVLVFAVFASLALGVLIAYAICMGMFHIFRIHSIQAAQARAEQQERAALASAQVQALSN